MLVHVQLDGRERVLSLTDFEDRVAEGAIGPETPARLGADGAWVAAGSLPAFAAAAASPAALLRRRFARPPVPWATAVTLGLAVRMHLWLPVLPGGVVAYDRLARSTPHAVERGEVGRFLTYGLLHADWGHLASNGLMLAWCGLALETAVGAPAVAALVVASVVGGGLFSALADPATVAVGASAADFGFLGAAVVLGWRYREQLPRATQARFGAVLAVLTAWNLVNGAFAERVDNAAHLGGLLVGGAAMATLRLAGTPEGDRHNRRVAGGLVGAAIGLLVALWAVGPAVQPTVPLAADGVVSARPAWWRTGVTPSRELGWTSPAQAGAVAARTTLEPRATSAEAAADRALDALRAVDPGAAETARVPWTSPEGHPGLRVSTRWTVDGRPGGGEALLVVRGRYVSTVTVDVPDDAPRLRAHLVARALDAARFPDPDALADAERAGPPDSPRGRAARARVLADLGRTDEALGLYGDPAGLDARATAEWLGLHADLPADRVTPAAEAAVRRFPDDRKVRLAAVDALLAAGAAEAARGLVEAGLAASPGDAALERARARLP